MQQISNTLEFNKKLQNLIDLEYYLGNLTESGFIVKRNFGVRRLVIYGKLNENNSYEIRAKNEILFQVTYLFGGLLLIFLTVLMLYNQNYPVALLCSIMVLLMYLAEKHQRNKEVKTFLKYLHENPTDHVNQNSPE